MAKNVVKKGKTNDFALLGLVFSIVLGVPGLIFSFLFGILGIVFTIVCVLPGLIFSIIALNRIKKTGEPGKGMAIAGIIISISCSVLSVLVLILSVIFGIAVMSSIYSTLYDYDYDYDSTYDPYDYMTDREKCNSYWTECANSDWYCEEYGCYCEYDDGDNYDYLWCSSYYFD